MLEQYMQRKCVEVRHPAPGQRHNTETIYVQHRFEVKGGITREEWMRRQYERPSKLWAVFQLKRQAR